MEPTLEIEMLNERIDAQNKQIEELKSHLIVARAAHGHAEQLATKWIGLAADLADALASYEALDHAGIGEQALARYSEARNA